MARKAQLLLKKIFTVFIIFSISFNSFPKISNQDQKKIQKFLKHYNENRKNPRLLLQNNKDALRILDEFKITELPKVRRKKDKIFFSEKGMKVTLEIIDVKKGLLKFNGVELQKSSEVSFVDGFLKLFYILNKTLIENKKKKVSWSSLFINTAQADVTFVNNEFKSIYNKAQTKKKWWGWGGVAGAVGSLGWFFKSSYNNVSASRIGLLAKLALTGGFLFAGLLGVASTEGDLRKKTIKKDGERKTFAYYVVEEDVLESGLQKCENLKSSIEDFNQKYEKEKTQKSKKEAFLNRFGGKADFNGQLENLRQELKGVFVFNKKAQKKVDSEYYSAGTYLKLNKCHNVIHDELGEYQLEVSGYWTGIKVNDTSKSTSKEESEDKKSDESSDKDTAKK